MDWVTIGNEIIKLFVFPILGILSIYICYLISVKIKESKKKLDNETASKYLDMLNDTITKCVIATNQTYVNALKDKNLFDEKAQKEAFKQTYDAVFKILTEEAKTYLSTIVGDLEAYVTNKIESDIPMVKSIK